MAKDPAFLFYPGDWLGGTMYMTHQEKGCYMDLLMLQFNKGRFTLAQAKHMLNGSFDVAWANIEEKFNCVDGLYYNERLEMEKEKRAKFSESRRNNAKQPKKGTSTSEASAEHMLQHMENENENINNSNISITTTLIENSIFKKFNHLSITHGEVAKLRLLGYSQEQIDEVLMSVENYRNNKSYTSLYLTAMKWLKKQHPSVTQPKINGMVPTTDEEYEDYIRPKKHLQST